MKKLMIEELRTYEIELLTNFDLYCKENNLTYFLAYGTLLGAVRHKGFIPWDDDIDVCMPRSDYEKFSQLKNDYQKKFSDNIVKICGDKDYPFPFTKIENIKTRVFEHCMNKKVESGVWLDIFPFDGISDNEAKITKILEKQKKIKRIIQKSLAIPGTIGRNSFFRFLNYFFIPLAKVCVFLCNLQNKADRLTKNNDLSKMEFAGTTIWIEDDFSRNILKKNEVFPVTQVEFCGKYYSSPKNPDYYLTKLYGDYMKLPPENERTTHLEDAWEL